MVKRIVAATLVALGLLAAGAGVASADGSSCIQSTVKCMTHD
jgi:hypothetical protein